MQCSQCTQKAVIELQHGPICKIHFIDYFEERVFKTINRFHLINRDDKLCVAASGGKDSLSVLYLVKKYCQKHQIPTENLFALVVDEGIKGYRSTTLKDLEVFCKQHKIKLIKTTAKDEFGATLDQAYPIINKSDKKKPCNVCGVWRRYLLNKYARQQGATKVVTGHNLDDEAQAIIMNLFKANTTLAGRLGPISGVEEQEGLVQRVKPLYLCPEKEVRLYAYLKAFPVHFIECPYSKEGYRHDIQTMLNQFEEKYRGTKQGVINSYLDILPLLKQTGQKESVQIRECKECGEPANAEVCNACKMKAIVQLAMKKDNTKQKPIELKKRSNSTKTKSKIKNESIKKTKSLRTTRNTSTNRTDRTKKN
ncbi:TIGR00269 family protein [Candidatus Woesearchaeota archaeon]|nr:TIGR00269 family protein [Candidatus Woesearchaeota archaeon]